MIKQISLFLAKILLIITIAILGSVLILPSQTQAATSTHATITLIAKDSQGNKVTNVKYAVYKQLTDISNNPVLGAKLTSGTIGDTGSITIKINTTGTTSMPLAITYNVGSKTAEKFSLYNQSANGAEIKAIRLPISSVRITLKDAEGLLLKDMSFDLYSVATDASNNKVADAAIYTGQKTGTLGFKNFYLIPGDYAIRVKFSTLTSIKPLDLIFTVSNDSQTNFNYNFNTLNITVLDKNGTYIANKYFQIFIYDDTDNNGAYKQIGTFKSDANGLIKTYLPSGDYQVYVKKNSGEYELAYEFTLGSGVDKNLTYRLGVFTLKVENSYQDPLALQNVAVYSYKNSAKGTKVWSGQTDSSGEVDLTLAQGNYIAEITTPANNFVFQTSPFYIAEDTSVTYEYILSLARIYLQDNQGANFNNQNFTIYKYATDAKGNVKLGAKLLALTTNNSGFAEIYLPASRYILKIGAKPEIYPIIIVNGKLNNLFVSTRSGLVVQDTTPAPAPAPAPAPNPSPAPQPSIAMASVYTNDNLYNKDTDGDTLTDFEEIYIWHTNPYNADSDGDGYHDNVEIPAGFDPNGPVRKSYVIWAYDKPRVSDIRVEQQEAAYLKAQLAKRIGTGYQLSDQDWNTIIRSFVYGGYSIYEIQNTIVYGPGMVHPTIPAYIWRRHVISL